MGPCYVGSDACLLWLQPQMAGRAADRANEEKALCEVLAMSRFPVAEHWDTAQAHGSLWGRWDAWYPVIHHINGREALVTLFTACNPEQGPSVTNRLSLKLQELSSPSRMELGTRLSSPLICTSHMTLKSLTTFRLSPSQISSKFSL